MRRLQQDDLVPALIGIQAMLTLLAFQMSSDSEIADLLFRASDLVSDAIQTQI